MAESLAADSPSSTASPTSTKNAKSSFTAPPWPTVRRIVEALGWIAVAVLVFTGLSAIFLRADFMMAYLGELNPNVEELDPFAIRYVEHTMATWLHLIPGFFVMILGPLQFMRGIRKRWPKAHRLSGRVFLASAGIGALSGIVIGVFNPFMGIDGQGFNESMATAFFSVYILFCLVMAFVRIKARKIAQHREWMIRAFALLLAIAMERQMLGVLMGTTSIDIAILFGTTFWMAAVTNMAAAEIWINLTRTPGSGAQHWKDVDAKARNLA